MRTSQGIVLGLGLVALSACGGSDSKAVGGTGGEAGDSPQAGDCNETPVFSARAYGENGSDLIRSIVREESTGDLFFSDFETLYRLPGGAGEPVTLGARPNADIDGAFWLTADSVLFPGGFQVPLIETADAVLSRTDRTVMDPQVVVPMPTPASINYQFAQHDVRIVGDDVYWIASDKYTDRPQDLPPKWQTTYVLRKTSWRKPAQPEDLYSTEHELKALVIAAGKAFLDEETTPDSYDYVQRIIDLESRQPDPKTGQDLYGGEVVAGDDASLIVSRTTFEVPNSSGIFRVAPDGTQSTRLSTNSFINDLANANGTWVFDDSGLGDAHTVWSYRVDTGLQRIGCIADPVTVHALAVSDSSAWVATYRDSTATILKFGL